MTNRHGNWERLKKVIIWSDLSINSFAERIGLSRAENLYHIKKGNYGISVELADRIIMHYPEIDRTWLLSGTGDMFVEGPSKQETLPFYRRDISEIMFNIDSLKPCGEYTIPFNVDGNIVVRSSSRAMNDVLSTATDLILREESVEDVVQGNEYVLIIEGRVEWRRVRYVARDNERWRLVARNRDEYPDIFVDRSAVSRAWRVVARLSILES